MLCFSKADAIRRRQLGDFPCPCPAPSDTVAAAYSQTRREVCDTFAFAQGLSGPRQHPSRHARVGAAGVVGLQLRRATKRLLLVHSRRNQPAVCWDRAALRPGDRLLCRGAGDTRRRSTRPYRRVLRRRWCYCEPEVLAALLLVNLSMVGDALRAGAVVVLEQTRVCAVGRHGVLARPRAPGFGGGT
jgi:hypothetical protein